MGQMQGIQGYQAIQTLNNDIYDSAGSNSSSSYISSSGIKSILLNAWNAVKSAVSGMLSSFGSHLSGQQGSDKPGRDITMDMSSRPAMPLPGIDEQFDNMLYGSTGGNVYAAVSERPESFYASVDDDAFVREPVASPVSGAQRLSLTESIYSEIEEPQYEEIGEGTAQTPPPVNLSTHPSLSESLYSEIEEPLYAEIGEGQDQTPPPVNLSTHPSLSRLPGSGDDIYAEPRDSLKTVNEAQSEAIGLISTSMDDNYAVSQDVMNAGSTPENDPRGDSDYDTPWKSQPDTQLQQRIMRERLNTP
ncbi:hypothetical protein [Morganella morganii]|uniref:hypothetical protein n=1 Tax=Morganella morganii TaxID=582 RepID=UPI0032D9C5BC